MCANAEATLCAASRARAAPLLGGSPDSWESKKARERCQQCARTDMARIFAAMSTDEAGCSIDRV